MVGLILLKRMKKIVDEKIESFLIKSCSHFLLPELSFALITNDYKELEVFNKNKFEPSLYKVGSLTKLVTSLAILKLGEEGLLNLNDKVSQYLDLFDNQSNLSKTLTVLDLLQHTGGLPRGDFYIRTPSIDIIKGKIREIEKTFISGSKTYKYSNLGYIILGLLIEQVTEESYASYIQKNIFIPLEMNNSGFEKNKTVLNQITLPHSLSYFSNNNSSPYDYKKISLCSAPEASFDMHSSVEDFSRLMSCILNEGKHKDKEILKKNSIDLLLNSQYSINKQLNSCMGLLSMNAFTGVLLFQNGEHWGHSASMILFPKRNFGLLVMTNRNSAGTDLFYLLQMITKYLMGNKKTNFLNFTYFNPEKVVGEYISDDLNKIIVTKRAQDIFISYNCDKERLLIYKGRGCFIQPKGELSKYIICLDTKDDIIQGLNIGPFYFKSKTNSFDKCIVKKYAEIAGIYFNSKTGRVAVFERNSNLILAYSPFKEAILQETSTKNIFLQISGPFVGENIFIGGNHKILKIGELSFKQTLFKY